MRIGELSRRTGVSVRMLRYYEAEGLLDPPRRPSGYRDYSEADAQQVARIRLLGEAGLKLETIRRFLPCVVTNRPDFHPCPELRAALRHEVKTLETHIARLGECHRVLSGYLDSLPELSPDS